MSADALIARFEEERSRALGRFGRKQAGLYYTPPTIAAEVLAIALRTSGVEDGRVLDPGELVPGERPFLEGGSCLA